MTIRAPGLEPGYRGLYNKDISDDGDGNWWWNP